MPTKSELLDLAEEKKDLVESFLLDLIKLPSVHGNEAEAQDYVMDTFRKLGYNTLEVPIDEEIREDPEYSNSDLSAPYEGRPNIVLSCGEDGKGRSVILNTHNDVVPATSWPDAFDPVVLDGFVIGRGSVDCKGQVAALYLLLLMLKEFRVKLDGKLTCQVVIEEEIGGNGTLSLIRKGYRADGAVVLEGSDLIICPANRGAVWFKATVEGRSIHMARKTDGISAIDKSIELIRLLYDYEKRLSEESQGQPLFSEYDHPVQVNIGRLEAGDWPSTVPGIATLEGGVGFLPNKDLETVKRELLALPSSGDEWLAAHTDIEFPRLHNDAYQIPAEHPLVSNMVDSSRWVGIDTRVHGMIASCDARLFNKVGVMPTIVFGAGDIDQAHSKGERVKMNDLLLETCALFDFVRRWCGVADA